VYNKNRGRGKEIVFLDEAIEAAHAREEALKKQIADLTTAAAKGGDGASTPAPKTPLAETRQANWLSRMLGGAGRG
jgi:hypothetical protein